MSESTPNPLELATEEELVDELARRNEAVIVSVIRPGKKAADPFEELRSWQRGGFTLCLGLASRIYACMKAEAVGKVRYVEDDDE